MYLPVVISYFWLRYIIFQSVDDTAGMVFPDIDPYIDSLVQNCSNSSALAMELLQSYAKLSIFNLLLEPMLTFVLMAMLSNNVIACAIYIAETPDLSKSLYAELGH